MCAWRAAIVIATVVAACGRAPIREHTPLEQSAYVWQRNWTPAVREAVAHAPVRELRVLTAEVDARGALARVPIDTQALVTNTRVAVQDAGIAHDVVLVVRIEGARPIEGLSLAPIVALGRELEASGVRIAGLEVDHDCATARLPDYARWLATQRPPWRFSITALPTWANGDVAAVAKIVDEIVVQVHAVRAPLIFDANQAARDLARFARAVDKPMRVALPTYSAVVKGMEVGVDPRDVDAFVRHLEEKPVAGVKGIVWFRLPVEGDTQTWSAATFARIVARQGTDAPRARVSLVAQGDDRYDVVASNPGDERVELPPVHITGAVDAADLVAGYREQGPGRWDAPPRTLARKESIVIGWIHGKDIALVD